MEIAAIVIIASVVLYMLQELLFLMDRLPITFPYTPHLKMD